MKTLQIIIPVRTGGNAYTTLASLAKQTYRDFDIVVSQDEWGNANRARNEGLRLAAPSKYVLFSDDDIDWYPEALRWMVDLLDGHPHFAYAYGTYLMGDRSYCHQHFNLALLKQRNFVSMMSVFRRDQFPGWDESIERLQDYELVLRLAKAGKYGQHCGHVIFETAVRDGITRNGKISYEEAFQIIRRKHGL